MELSVEMIIRSKIFEVRKQKVMLDFDLAQMYSVENRALKQAVKRNRDRFPEDFMFELSKMEWQELITNCDKLPDTVKFSPATPYAFTEQGVAMLSSILKSKKAIQVNITIVRSFVFMRKYALTHSDLTEKLKAMEEKYNTLFKDISDAINYLLQKDKVESIQKQRNRIGYK